MIIHKGQTMYQINCIVHSHPNLIESIYYYYYYYYFLNMHQSPIVSSFGLQSNVLNGLFISVIRTIRERGSSDSTVTRYWLDGPRIKFRCGEIFRTPPD